MKTCPTCHQNYEDDSLKFCLEDGAQLVALTTASGADPTLVLPRQATEPPPIAQPQPTLTSAGFTPAANNVVTANRGTRSNALLVVAAVIIGASAIAVALIVTRSGRPDTGAIVAPAAATPLAATAQPSPTATPFQSQADAKSSSTPVERKSGSGSETGVGLVPSSTPRPYSSPAPSRSTAAAKTTKRGSSGSQDGPIQIRKVPGDDSEMFIPVAPKGTKSTTVTRRP